jgi:cellulose synthase/poly-beta-1,6-N-acetylglucosamine synthase-like glycosyltransferase
MTSDAIILVSYFFVLSILGIYGWHRYYLVYEYRKHRHRVPGPPPELIDPPVVTVQLPIYNEMYVVDRLVDAVCGSIIGRQLEIQVLDDSTDETQDIGRWPSGGMQRAGSTSSCCTAPTARVSRPARSKKA